LTPNVHPLDGILARYTNVTDDDRQLADKPRYGKREAICIVARALQKAIAPEMYHVNLTFRYLAKSSTKSNSK